MMGAPIADTNIPMSLRNPGSYSGWQQTALRNHRYSLFCGGICKESGLRSISTHRSPGKYWFGHIFSSSVHRVCLADTIHGQQEDKGGLSGSFRASIVRFCRMSIIAFVPRSRLNIEGRTIGTGGTFPLCVNISSKPPADQSPKCSRNRGHLNFNRPYDQLSSRTPPAIVDADVRADASPSPLSKFRRSRSAHTPSLFLSTRPASLPIAFSKIRNLQHCPHSDSLSVSGNPSAAAHLRSRPVCSPFVFMVLQIAFPATRFF